MINFFSSFSNLFPSLTCYDSLDMILYLSVLVCQINLCLFLLSSKDFSFSFYSLFCTFVNFQVTIYDLLMNNYKRQVCFAVFCSVFQFVVCSFQTIFRQRFVRLDQTINFQITKKTIFF